MTGDPRPPTRTCVGCRTRCGTGNLVRVAQASDGSLMVSRTAPGRGAWLCREPGTDRPAVGCLDKALRRNAFSRAFRTDVAANGAAPLRAEWSGRENMEVPEQ